jgi:hypothetical protein
MCSEISVLGLNDRVRLSEENEILLRIAQSPGSGNQALPWRCLKVKPYRIPRQPMPLLLLIHCHQTQRNSNPSRHVDILILPYFPVYAWKSTHLSIIIIDFGPVGNFGCVQCLVSIANKQNPDGFIISMCKFIYSAFSSSY